MGDNQEGNELETKLINLKNQMINMSLNML